MRYKLRSCKVAKTHRVVSTKKGNKVAKPADMAQNTMSIQLNPFDGNPDEVVWFTSQVLDMQDVNKWTEPVALLFLKSKLRGAAQSWYASSPSCQQVTKLKDACELLVGFFAKEKNPTSNQLAFQAISMQPGETVKSLAHRIESLAHQIYPAATGAAAIDQIKSIQFLTAVHPSLREKIALEPLSDFKALVEKANSINTLQQNLELMQAHSLSVTPAVIPPPPVMNHSTTASSTDVMEQLVTQLAQQVLSCPLCRQTHSMAQCELFHQLIGPRQEQAPSGLPHTQTVETAINNHLQDSGPAAEGPPDLSIPCLFCHRRGHTMAECRTLLNHPAVRSPIFNPQLQYPTQRDQRRFQGASGSPSYGNRQRFNQDWQLNQQRRRM